MIRIPPCFDTAALRPGKQIGFWQDNAPNEGAAAAASTRPAAVKRPASTVKGVNVSSPHYHKNNNSWGLKIGPKQIISAP